MLQAGYHNYLQGVLQNRPMSAPQELKIRSEEEEIWEKISEIDEKINKYLARKERCLAKLQAIEERKQRLTGPSTSPGPDLQ